MRENVDNEETCDVSSGKRFIKGFEFVCKCREYSLKDSVSKLPLVAAFGKGLGLGGLVQNISECKNQDVSMHWVNKNNWKNW